MGPKNVAADSESRPKTLAGLSLDLRHSQV